MIHEELYPLLGIRIPEVWVEENHDIVPIDRGLDELDV